MHQVSFQVKMVQKHSGLERVLPSVFACVLIALRYSHSHSSPYPISLLFPLFNLLYRLYAAPTPFTICHIQIHLFVHSVLFGAYHAHTPVLAATLLHMLVVFYVIVLYSYWHLVNSFWSFVMQIIHRLLSKAFPNNLSSLLSFSFNEKSLNFFLEVSCFDPIICSLSHKCCGQLIQGPPNTQKN